MRPALAALVVLLAIPAGAPAADPAEGDVSREAPALVWQGTASGSPVIWADFALAAEGYPILCAAPFCDTFTLHVLDAADLRIESSSCADDVTAVEVEPPDGRRLFADGREGSPRTVVDIKAAVPGTYTVRTLVNVPPAAPGAYIGHATLAVPPVRATLTAFNRRVSMTHATSGDRVRIALAASAPITMVRAVLLGARRAIVGSGRLTELDGQGSVVLTLSRTLKPRTYRVAITADDDSGPIQTKAALRVSRRHTYARTSRYLAPRDSVGSPSPALC